MKPPIAFDITGDSETPAQPRAPRAFAVEDVPDVLAQVESYSDAPAVEDAPTVRRRGNWLVRLVTGTAGLLLSLAVGLALNALMVQLFATQPWLGWLGLGVLGVFLIALVALIAREVGSVWRLRQLDRMRTVAAEILVSDSPKAARGVVADLRTVYANRADMARPLDRHAADAGQIFDGAEMIRYSERVLLAPLDARARALTAAAARRVALVTAVSPRALVDIAFVVWESVRLGGAIARLYGARPGLLGTWRLFGAILSHLAITGGLVLTDGLVEQLVGQGLAARLSQRLGEGVVNGLMTVRVGIAAMRVVRPLPFATESQPLVRDFLPELANVVKTGRES